VIRAPATAAAIGHPLALLGRDYKFFKGIQIGLTLTEENPLSLVPKNEFLSATIKFQCQGVMLARLAANTPNQKVEEISWLEHELVEASS